MHTLPAVALHVGVVVSPARDQLKCITGPGAVRSVSAPGDHQEGSDRHQHCRHVALGHIRDDLRYDRRVPHLLLFEQLLQWGFARLLAMGAVA